MVILIVYLMKLFYRDLNGKKVIISINDKDKNPYMESQFEDSNLLNKCVSGNFINSEYQYTPKFVDIRWQIQ